jgi:hypothetical protein
MLGRSRRVLTAAVVAIPLVLVICKLALTACAEGMSDVWIGRPGTRCFAVALLAGAGPFAAILWTRRRTVTSAVHWSGAAVGTAAGAIGWTVNELRCQVGYAPHVLLGHVLPMLIFVGLGVALSALLVPRSVRLS